MQRRAEAEEEFSVVLLTEGAVVQGEGLGDEEEAEVLDDLKLANWFRPLYRR